MSNKIGHFFSKQLTLAGFFLQIIVVHCTHGFNRTGFMICSFMVLVWDWSIEASLECFTKVRPPGIYKEDYIRELCL